MTDLKNYNHAEQVNNPDDSKLSEQHGAERLTTQANIAESRIKEISVSRSAGGGLDEFFGGMEHRTWLEGDPWTVANQVKKRVLLVAGQSADDYRSSLGSSSASSTEKQLLGYTQKDMLKQIEKSKATGLNSLQTLETLKGFTASAMEEAKEQHDRIKEKQQSLIENRSRWSKFGHGLLTGATLGAYQLVKTSKRQKRYNKVLERVMNRQFDKINRNIEDLENKAGKRIAPMQSKIRRTLAGAGSASEKAAYQTELLNALQHTGDLSGVNLNKWGITKPQDKIDFLEAARGVDFVKDTLGVAVSSRAKQMAQEEIVNSAQKQQEIMNGKAKFEEVRDTIKADGITSSEKVLSVSEIVAGITNDLSSAGIDVERDIYYAEAKKADLLTDTARLVMLVNYLGKTSSKHVKLQLQTRQELLSWIENQDKESSGGMESHDNTKAKAELEILQKDKGVLDKMGRKLNQVKSLKINSSGNTPAIIKSEIETACKNAHDKYQEFLAKEYDEDFSKEDFEKIKKIWEKALEVRKFLLGNVAKWVKEKEEYNAWNKEQGAQNGSKVAEINDKLNILSGTSHQSIRGVDDEISGLTGTSAEMKVKGDLLKVKLGRLIAEKENLEGTKAQILGQKAPVFTGLDKVQDFLDSLSIERTANYERELKKTKSVPGTLNERIQKSLRVNDFVEELDKKFVEQLEKNDQFEDLKKVSKGTSVGITFKRTSANSLRFPDQLKNQVDQQFIVVSSNDFGVILENPTTKKSITILGPVAKGGVAYKNARLSKTSGAGTSASPNVSGSWESAVAYNFKIPA